jgi:2,3-bisphosphoglycerate-dependent phosphoglycerate mutase
MRPLSGSGRSAAEKLAEPLSALGLTAIYSSPYRRAIETVEPLAIHLNLPIHEIADLRERTLGSISSIPFEDAIASSFSNFELSFPGGESSRDAQQRAVQVVDRLLVAHPADRIVISTHGNLLSLLLNAYSQDIGFDFWRSLTLPDVFHLQVSAAGDATFERLAV